MSDDAKLKEAQASLVGMVRMCAAILKHGDPAIIIAAADSLEAATASAECKAAIEALQVKIDAKLSGGWN